MPRLVVVILVALLSVTATSACGRASDPDEPASSSTIVPFAGVDDQRVTATRPEWPAARPVTAREARRELRRVGAQARSTGDLALLGQPRGPTELSAPRTVVPSRTLVTGATADQTLLI